MQGQQALVDTDVLIWNLRGSERAASLLDDHHGFCISAVTYMELVQGLRNKKEFAQSRQAIRFWEATIIHVTEAISGRATYLVELHALASALQLADALIVATALETGLALVSGNVKHYRPIEGVSLRKFPRKAPRSRNLPEYAKIAGEIEGGESA